jgi:DNA-binding XRE family transcriptional regulator
LAPLYFFLIKNKTTKNLWIQKSIQIIFLIELHLTVRNSDDIKAFGQRLREVRTSKGWSQQYLADVANVPKITIQRIELAKTSPTLDMVYTLAKALEMEVIIF